MVSGSLNSVRATWAKAATAARYEVRLSQTGAAAKQDVSIAVVDGSSGTTFTKTFDNLTPGSYSVAVYGEKLGGITKQQGAINQRNMASGCCAAAAGVLMQLHGTITACRDSVKLSSMLYRRSVSCIPSRCPPCAAPPTLPAAINVNGDGSASAATSGSDVVVGAPLPPSISAVSGGVGQLTVTWSAPAINADLGVTYALNIEDVTAGRTPATPLVTESLTAGAPSQTISGLAAGTKRVWITATNANAGDGKTAAAVQAAWAGTVAVQLSTQPGISQTVGSATGAAITVTAPSASSATAINKFLIQVGSLGRDEKSC